VLIYQNSFRVLEPNNDDVMGLMENNIRAYHYCVEVIDGDQMLGYVSIAVESEIVIDSTNWEGRILGSDYLVWGLNHRKIELRFHDGTIAEVVVRSGGKIICGAP
jgi:hypothetical protein